MRRPLMLALLTALVGLLILTRFYPQVTRTEVLGASHYSDEEILALAHLERGDPLLWVTKWRSASLVQDSLDQPRSHHPPLARYALHRRLGAGAFCPLWRNGLRPRWYSFTRCSS